MDWMSSDTLRALTASSVLLALVLVLGWSWAKDRNARIDDMRRYADQWQKAHEISEMARERERDKNAAALETLKLTNALLSGFRQARDWADSDRSGST